VNWDLHSFPSGEEVVGDVVEAGLWFYPKGQGPQHETRGDFFDR